MNDNLSSWDMEDAFQSLAKFPPSGNQEISMAEKELVELMWQNKQLIMHNHIAPEGNQFVAQLENQTSLFQENQTANQFVSLDDNLSTKESCYGIPASQSISRDQHHHTNNIRNNMADFGLTQDVIVTTTAAADNNTHQKSNSNYQMLPPNPQVGGEREYSSNSNFAPQDVVKQTNGVRRKFPNSTGGASTYDTNSSVASTYDGLGWSGGRSNIRSYKRNCLRFEEYGSQSEEADDPSSTVGKHPHRSASARRSRAAEVHNMSERRRRDRINERMKALQQLIPHCNKTDKASMLEEAIEYLKSLQLQVQIMWMSMSTAGMAPMVFPNAQRYISRIGRSTDHQRGSIPSNIIPNPVQTIPMASEPGVNTAPIINPPEDPLISFPNQMQNPNTVSNSFASYHLGLQNIQPPSKVFSYGTAKPAK